MVMTPAAITFDAVIPSQSVVTQSMARDIKVRAVVRNTGGSEAHTLTAPAEPSGTRTTAAATPAAARGNDRAGTVPTTALLAQSAEAVEDPATTAPPASPDSAATPAVRTFSLPAGFEAAGADLTAAPAGPAPSESAATRVALPVPLESPEFAHAFGVQVSVLVRDGVHEAELHLNPAEMGPVSVQIALDGVRAHIDFGAQAAGTRAAIEASLPELAAALRDAGLTLSGGGVSQHTAGRDSGERGQSGTAAGSHRARADATAAAAARPVWRGRVSPGGVDLYA